MKVKALGERAKTVAGGGIRLLQEKTEQGGTVARDGTKKDK